MKPFRRIAFRAQPDWRVEISAEFQDGRKIRQSLPVSPPESCRVEEEEHRNVPLFRENKFLSGSRLRALIADECTVSGCLLPDTLRVFGEPGREFRPGVDYYADPVWGAWGRLADGGIRPRDRVRVSYSYVPLRIDSIVFDGEFRIRHGALNGATPLPPSLNAGETALCNLFFDRPRRYFSREQLFPLQEPFTPPPVGAAAEKLPRTLRKLRNGEPCRILAWGDSVTRCDYIHPTGERWPNQVAAGLKRRFPRSRIRLVNLGWPGKGTSSFLNEPPDSRYHYESKVLGSGADLVILEFVNDAWLTCRKEFDRIYRRIVADMRERGMELLVVVPHPVRPDWMGMQTQNRIAGDPRPYVKYLRELIDEFDLPAADVSGRFLHLWKEGIPYNTLMRNNINHPDLRGMALYAQTVLNLFPED